MVELLSGRLGNIAIDGRVSGSLLCTIGLYDLTGNFLLAAENRRRCPVLPIDDRKLTAFHRRYYYRGELRPIEILGDLVDVGRASPTDFTLKVWLPVTTCCLRSSKASSSNWLNRSATWCVGLSYQLLRFEADRRSLELNWTLLLKRSIGDTEHCFDTRSERRLAF